jgi:hypothetical protein
MLLMPAEWRRPSRDELPVGLGVLDIVASGALRGKGGTLAVASMFCINTDDQTVSHDTAPYLTYIIQLGPSWPVSFALQSNLLWKGQNSCAVGLKDLPEAAALANSHWL